MHITIANKHGENQSLEELVGAGFAGFGSQHTKLRSSQAVPLSPKLNRPLKKVVKLPPKLGCCEDLDAADRCADILQCDHKCQGFMGTFREADCLPELARFIRDRVNYDTPNADSLRSLRDAHSGIPE